MMTKLKGKRIAIIGGAGFIGHNLALALKQRGAHVEVIDSLQVNNLIAVASDTSDNPYRELHLKILYQRLDLLREAGITLHARDARDYHILSPLLNEIKPNAIIHLAAVAHAGRSNKDPFSTFDHSLRTLENALDCARSQSVEHFIYFSSSMVYGNFLSDVVDEEHPLNPIGIYGALKVGGEKMVIAYQQVFDIPFTIVRPSALYGPRCISRRVGQIFIENALNGSTLHVEGDGSERIDFTYIDDLIEGIARVIVSPAARNQIFNMTYGSARSIKELVETIVAEFPQVQVEYVERDSLMPFRGTLSVEKARRLIGYEPQYPVEEGFPKYIEWYRSLGAGVPIALADA